MFRHIMPAGEHALSNAPHRKIGTAQPQENKMKVIALPLEPLDPDGVRGRRKRRLKRKVFP
jgi:hypothetical protein